jgi:hypothetical protein
VFVRVPTTTDSVRYEIVVLCFSTREAKQPKALEEIQDVVSQRGLDSFIDGERSVSVKSRPVTVRDSPALGGAL